MHDFCLTFMYGTIFLSRGFIGLARERNIFHFAECMGFGILLSLAAFVSFCAYSTGKTSFLPLICETVCAAILTWIYAERNAKETDFYPIGFIAWTSAFMTVFYLFKIVSGGNRLPRRPPRNV